MIYLNAENFSVPMDRLSAYGAFLMTPDGTRVNPMTIGWGLYGIACGKPVFSVMVRQSRHSHKLLDSSGIFAVSIPTDDRYRRELSYCGAHSGRDEDKVSALSLPLTDDALPGVRGCTTLYCRVIFKTVMTAELTGDAENNQWYKNGDYHTIFTGEITDIKEN